MIEWIIDIPNLKTVHLPESFRNVQSKSITSIYMNNHEWIDVHDNLGKYSCLGGRISIEIIRTCGSSKWNERVDIYQGRSTDGYYSIFYQSNCYSGTFYRNICPTVHTIVMRDSYGSLWESGSSVTIRYKDQSYSYSGPNNRYSSRSETFQFVGYSYFLLIVV